MSPNDFKHLHPDIRAIAARSKEERIKWIRSQSRWIEHPTATKIQDRLWEVFTQPRSSRIENILLYGESGVGKTALVDIFMEKMDPREGKTGTASKKMAFKQRPIIKVLMPAEPKPAELYRSIFRAAEISWYEPNHLRPARLLNEVRIFLKSSGTQLLLLDEINSLLAGTSTQQRIMLQHLRVLSNELGIALVCVGTPEAETALISDEQLRRRFRNLEMPRWQEGDDLKDFIHRLVQALPLQQPSPVESQALRKLMVSRSGGVTHYICKALERAAISAIQSDREMIDLGALQSDEVWDTVVNSPPWDSHQQPAR